MPTHELRDPRDVTGVATPVPLKIPGRSILPPLMPSALQRSSAAVALPAAMVQLAGTPLHLPAITYSRFAA